MTGSLAPLALGMTREDGEAVFARHLSRNSFMKRIAE